LNNVQPDLEVELCGTRLKHPLLLASGGLGESADTLAPFQDDGASAVVTRTMRLHVSHDRLVFPSPHMTLGPRKSWMLNCEWGNLRPFEYWLRTGLPEAVRRGPVIVSLSGRDIDDCVEASRRVAEHPVMVEINVSCSHAGRLYGRLTDDAVHVTRLVTALKDTVSVPVIVKLGWSPAIAEVASAAAQAGADAIATTNSIGPGLDLDLWTGRPRLGIQGGIGGVTGRAVFPIALECVHQVVEATGLPVIGIGGVSSYQEAVKMIMVGATCVQVYTEAFLQGPTLFQRMVRDLAGYLTTQGRRSVSELRGIARPLLATPSNLDPLVPSVSAERCKPCGLCSRVCPADAITLNGTARIDATACTGCGVCVDACPPSLHAISWP
jgi:dihydroorotate dehydrogenase (NAD+) catalytic subunit